MSFATPLRSAARLVLGSIFALVLSTGVAHAQGTWTGAASNFWVNPGNWVGGVLPTNDPTGTATFPNTAQTSVDQNFGALTLNALTTSGASYTFGGGGITFDGTDPFISVSLQPSTFTLPITFAAPLTLFANANITFTSGFSGTAGIVKQGSGTVTIAATGETLGLVDVQQGVLTTSQTTPDITRALNIAAGASVNTGPAEWAELSGAGNVALTGNTTFAGDGDSVFAGNIIGGFALTKGATGTLVLLGNNSWTGGTTVNGGELIVGNGSAGTFPAGPVTLGNGATLNLEPVTPATLTGVTGNGNLVVNGGTITASGPISTLSGDVTFFGGTTNAFAMNIQGTLAVFSPATLAIGPTSVRGFEGSGLVTFNTNFAVNNASDSNYSGVVAGTGFFLKDGSATLTLGGANTWTGSLNLGGGAVILNGSMVATVNGSVGTTFGGIGNASGPVLIPAGTISPGPTLGPGPGNLRTGNLSITGTGIYAADIEGNAPGSGYDRLTVTGTVTLGGTLQISGSYVPLASDTYVIIDNDGTDAVSGTFTGLAEGATFPFNGQTLRISYVGGTGNDVTLTPVAFTVTPSAGPNGTITPATPQQVFTGGTTSFTVTANTGYTASVGGSCGGTFTPPTYTTAAIGANCTVIATFTINSYTVTSSAGANGTITPSGAQSVNHGSTAVFTVTPAATYSASVGGTCGGTLVGTTYTTAPIVAPCTVVASFGQNTFTVTPLIIGGTGNGTISPSTPQTVVQGATTTFTVTPNAGYYAQAFGSCGGALVGNTFTTGPIIANCTASVNFLPLGVTTFTGPTATGTGNVTASFTGGGLLSCGFTNPQLIPVTGNPASPPAGTAPAAFPHGLFTFTLSNCVQGSTITMTVVYPAPLPAGTQYWKYGPEPGNATPHWYVLPATITGATVVFTITDGQLGDDDLTVNGTIVDQGGPGVPPLPPGTGAIQTPTLSEWMLMVLASLVLLVGMRKAAPGVTRSRNDR